MSDGLLDRVRADYAIKGSSLNGLFVRNGDTLVRDETCIHIIRPCVHGLECRVNNARHILVHNPVSGNWHLADASGRLGIWNGNYCQIVKCDALKYICFIISKNGCSCILRSALEYDGLFGNTSDDKFIWHQTAAAHYWCDGTLFRGDSARKMLDDPRYKDYKRFIVLQDERERFIKFINWTHKRRYNPYVDLSLSREASFREHVFLHPYFSHDTYVCDQHALPQGRHVDAFIVQLYGGDASRFWRDVEPVGLDDLREWFGDTFGKPMLMNNIDSEEDKLYRLESLSDGQRFSLEQLLASYPLYAKYSG